MSRQKILIPVLAGLVVGQLFADSERPFKVINTVRVGYTDNLYRNANNEASTFVTDTIDLSFRAALSDRTDLMVKSQLNLLTDTGSNELYPNLYAMLNHNISPRLLLRFSEYYRSGEKSGSGTVAAANDNVRHNYFQNKVEASADYVLTGKDRLGASLSHEMFRHDQEINELDYTTVGGGVSWKRELSPQRTYLTLNLNQSETTYDNNNWGDGPSVSTVGGVIYTNEIAHFSDQKVYDQTDLTIGLNHAFNQEWQGSFAVGASYVRRDFSGYTDTETSSVNPTPDVTTNNYESSLTPLLRIGVVYSPSPRTRVTGDLSVRHEPSNDNRSGGQDTSELRFGVQHDITAKLMAKATARFANTQYSSEDDATSSEERTEDRMDLELRFTYKLNRINFLELGLKHSESDLSDGGSWEQNMVDVGWRVELN